MEIKKANTPDGAQIVLVDQMDAEDSAMTQALYSRSNKSVLEHLDQIKRTGSSKFMDKFYVGYGHKSIGDCGDIDLYFEGVSCFVAKAIQDSPLYRGQECSTRYLDFSEGRAYNPDPLNSKAIRIIANWFNLYNDLMEPQVDYVMSSFPPPEDDSKAEQWGRACRAKSFDVLRGFLPAGVLTNLSWSTDLRQCADRLELLRHHPLLEVQEIARTTLDMLRGTFPSSFTFRPDRDKSKYLDKHGRRFHYFVDRGPAHEPSISIRRDDVDYHAMDMQFGGLILDRPKGAPLPKELEHYGQVVFDVSMDFGSFRDIQRQRKSIIPIAFVNAYSGFEPWYLDNLNPAKKMMASNMIELQNNLIYDYRIGRGKYHDLDSLQYLMPMGTLCKTRITCTIPQLVYIIELRSSQSVHPTVRKLAHFMARYLDKVIPSLKFKVDMQPDGWSLARGNQTILEK
jgi:thymidylate synthase ThyX